MEDLDTYIKNLIAAERAREAAMPYDETGKTSFGGAPLGEFGYNEYISKNLGTPYFSNPAAITMLKASGKPFILVDGDNAFKWNPDGAGGYTKVQMPGGSSGGGGMMGIIHDLGAGISDIPIVGNITDAIDKFAYQTEPVHQLLKATTNKSEEELKDYSHLAGIIAATYGLAGAAAGGGAAASEAALTAEAIAAGASASEAAAYAAFYSGAAGTAGATGMTAAEIAAMDSAVTGELGASGATYGGTTAAGTVAAGSTAAGTTGTASAGAVVPESVLSIPGVGSAGNATPALIGKAVTPAMTTAAKYLGMTVPEWLGAASLVITAAGTIGAMTDSGDKTTSATTTTTPGGPGQNPMPGGNVVTTTGTGTPGAVTTPVGTPTTLTPGGVNTLNPDGTPKAAGALAFEDFINDFYGLNAQTKSVQARGVEDQAALKGYQKTLLDSLSGLDTQRLTDTKAAVAPYQAQLADIKGQLSGNTGLGKQFEYSFGGKAMPSFVPKANRTLADQLLGMGRESSSINTGLVDMEYKSGTDLAGRQFGFNSENLPNKAADTYSAKLEALMKYLNPNTGTTQTTTGTVPGVPWYTTALQGLNTGVNLYNSIYNPRQATGTYADFLAWQKANGGA